MPSASPSPLIDLQGEQSPQQPSLVWCACMVEFQSGPGKQPSPAITGFVGGLVRGKGPDGVADLCLSLLSADFCLILPFSVSFQTFSIIYLQEFTHARTHTHTHTHTHKHTHTYTHTHTIQATICLTSFTASCWCLLGKNFSGNVSQTIPSTLFLK